MRSLAVFVTALTVLGCGGSLPEPIYANQMDAYFPKTSEARPAAEQCAARLNSHRSKAKVGGILQGMFSAVGGLASGAGGVIGAIDSGDKDVATAMGVLGAAGAGVTLIGNLIVGLFLNPVKELRLRTEGARSWDVAVELRYSGGSPQAIKESLDRCNRDEGPPVRVVGSGVVF